ncbi:MAG TPA: hypothetical protein VKC89_01460 [Patescibacteria group bacterium]|nr:hypothetical protein [Patescibacteria group bacterium]
MATEALRPVFPTLNDLKDPHGLKDQLMRLEKEFAVEAAGAIGHLLAILNDEQASHELFKALEGNSHAEHREHIRLNQAATRGQLYTR